MDWSNVDMEEIESGVLLEYATTYCTISEQMELAHEIISQELGPREFATGISSLIGHMDIEYYNSKPIAGSVLANVDYSELEELLAAVGFGEQPDVMLAGSDGMQTIELKCAPNYYEDMREFHVPAKPNAGYSTKRKNKQPWKADKFGRR